jgi:hypothetical protein
MIGFEDDGRELGFHVDSSIHHEMQGGGAREVGCLIFSSEDGGDGTRMEEEATSMWAHARKEGRER